jgi:Ca2+-binding EF-hand superfamily protein
MAPNFNQEDKEACLAAFNRVKGPGADTASLFEVCDALRMLGITAQSDELYKENKNFDVNFEKFCEIYVRKKEEKDKKELQTLVQQSFEALGGRANQQGVVDVNKLTEIFKFFEVDIEPEDFLARANLDVTGTILYEDYLQIFDLAGARQ